MAWYNSPVNQQDLVSFQNSGLPYSQGSFVNDKPMARQEVIDGLLALKNQGLNFTLTGGFGAGHTSPEHTTYGTAVDLVPQGKTTYDQMTSALKSAGFNTLVHNQGSGMHIHVTPGQTMIAGGSPQREPTPTKTVKPSTLTDRLVQGITGSTPASATTSPEDLAIEKENARLSAGGYTSPDKLAQDLGNKTGASPMNNLGFLGQLPQLGATQTLTDDLLRRGNNQPNMNRPNPMQNLMATQQMGSGGMAPQSQGMPQQQPMPQGRPGGAMGAAAPAQQPASQPEKKKMNLTPLSLALIGIGQNLLHPGTPGEFNALSGYMSSNSLNQQNIAADKEKQDKQNQLEREKMQLEKELTERKLASSEAESARRESYQDKLLALQEKELNMKTQAAGEGDIFGGNKNPALTAIRIMNDPAKFNGMTPETQTLLKQYAQNAVKDPNTLFEQKQSEMQGKQAGQTGKQGATVGDVTAMQAGGKNLAATEQQYALMTSKMPQLENTVNKLSSLAEAATYTKAGQFSNEFKRQLGIDVGDAGVARKEYEATINNQVLPLLRQTFGAQFTEREGQTLRETLGDINASPREKQAVLNSFIQQKRADIESSRQQIQIQQQQQGNMGLPGQAQSDAFSRQQLLEEAKRRNLM